MAANFALNVMNIFRRKESAFQLFVSWDPKGIHVFKNAHGNLFILFEQTSATSTKYGKI